MKGHVNKMELYNKELFYRESGKGVTRLTDEEYHNHSVKKLYKLL